MNQYLRAPVAPGLKQLIMFDKSWSEIHNRSIPKIKYLFMGNLLALADAFNGNISCQNRFGGGDLLQ